MLPNPFTRYGLVGNSGISSQKEIEGLGNTLKRWNPSQGGTSGIASMASAQDQLQAIRQSGSQWGAFSSNGGLDTSSRGVYSSGAFQRGGYNGSGGTSAYYSPQAIMKYREAWQRQAPSIISQALNNFMAG